MNWLVRTGVEPWGEDILTHAQWNLVYAAIAFGVCSCWPHAVRGVLAETGGGHTAPVDPALAARVPAKVKRHSLAARCSTGSWRRRC
jgi:hypothetical protein